jgi:hypothetical protein
MSQLDDEARTIVGQLDERQRAAIFRAIVDAQPQRFVPPPPPSPRRHAHVAARRRPTIPEILIGVKCCDVNVRRWWMRCRNALWAATAFALLVYATSLRTTIAGLGIIVCALLALVIVSQRGGPKICP